MIISLSNVTYEIDQQTLLDSVSLSVDDGEHIAIIGPSGAGKTTLIRLLSSTLAGYKGHASVVGIPLKDYTDSRSYADVVGVIRQGVDLVEELSVVNNVLAGRLRHWSLWQSIRSLIRPLDKDLAQDALASVHMADRMYSKVSILSGGEKQRVAIARVLMQNPKIILADEPIAALDPKLADDILTLLNDCTKGKTFIASLHQVAHAKHYFNRIIGMKDGSISFDLPSLEVSDAMIQELYERG